MDISKKTDIRKKTQTWRYIKKSIRNHWDLYLILLPVLAYFIIFCYWPMYGVQIAFRDFTPRGGIVGSNWVGLKHFIRFFEGYYFKRLIVNTIAISGYSIITGFFMPIFLALMLNEVGNKFFKKTVQTITYAPHFLSTVVVGGMIVSIFAMYGLFNNVLVHLGYERIDYLTKPQYFRNIYVWSGVWQSTGWSSIIYLAALSGIDPQLHEAAQIDGAGRLRRIWHINIPGIIPTMTILLILNCGSIMNVGFEKIFLLQNDLNRDTSDVISTYVYRVGLVGSEYSYSAAIGFFNSIINMVMLLIVNKISKLIGSTGLF